jgi:archaemetzincin
MYIVPLGEIEEELLASIDEGLQHVYGVPVKRLAGLPEPGYAFDAQRRQFSSAHILRQLIPCVPSDAVSLLAVTGHDLFIPMLSFVLGQAQLGAPAAVVSLARLHQEFYGLPPDRPLLLKRAIKEAVHEVGHTVGLIHCTSNLCPMSLSNTVLHVDIKGVELCGNCAVLVDEKIRNARPARSDSGGA